MFARTTNRSYTCLKCQYRLFAREVGWTEPQSINTRVRRRWQSSATNAAVNDDYGEEIPEAENQVPITYDSSSSFRHRRWRPTPTAEIGVDVLGKPAEILVLPTNRKKRRKHVRESDDTIVEDAEAQPQQDAEFAAHPRIHESLAAESKPAFMREALENIERIWEEAKETAVDGFLEREQWIKYFKALSTGFTKTQIERYLEENMSKSDSTPADGKFSPSSRSFTRSRAATEIMTNLWGFTNDLPKDSDRIVSKSLNVGRGRRELILGIDKEWRRFNQHVSIRASPTRGEIEIAGPETWVVKAQNVVSSLKRRVREQSLALPGQYSRALDKQGSPSDMAARSILLDLIEKHEITMTKRTGWTAYAFNSNDIADFERDLLLSQKRLPMQTENATTPPFLSLDPVHTNSPMPVYRHILASDGLELSRYSRVDPLSDNETLQTSINIGGEAVKNLTANLESQIYGKDTDILGYQFPHSSEASIGSAVHQHSASVGQLLHYSNDSNHESDISRDTPAMAPQTTFVSAIPFLSQFLSAQKGSLQNDAAGKNTTLILLAFIPLNIHTHPEVEIEATTSTPLDARSELNIKSVRLIFPPQQAQVIIPTTPFDLDFVRRTVVPIFEVERGVQESYVPFLGQLGAQLRQDDAKSGKSARRLQLNKLLDLDLDCLQTIGDTQSDTAKATARSTSVRYALDRAEMLEKHSYRLHEQDEVLLEHSAYIPLEDSSTQFPRETLTVVPTEADSSMANKDRHQNFIKSALQVVKVLTGFVAETTSAMSAKNKAQEQEQKQNEIDAEA